jgi:hypothetical protein
MNMLTVALNSLSIILVLACFVGFDDFKDSFFLACKINKEEIFDGLLTVEEVKFQFELVI